MIDDPDDKPFAEEDTAEEPPANPNAADREHQHRIIRGAKRAEVESAEFWRSTLGTEIGRRELYWLLSTMHFDRERFVESSNGSPLREATWAELGIQRIGFQLYRKWLGLAPEEMLLMLRENDPALRPPPKSVRRRRAAEFPWISGS